MTGAHRYQAVDTGHDGESHQQSATTHNTVNTDVATTVVQAGVITGGVHNHLPAPQPPVPTARQLVAAPTGFVGRADQLAVLDRALAGFPPSNGGRDGGATAVISAIGGTGGIGKTWLALTWAHRNLHRFPDGQLWVDLRGFSPGEPRHPTDVLAEFLAALGVDRDHQPTDLDARAALYRTHTTGKRLLILLDNAATTDQVEPLLPGGVTCTVLVTSRRRLDALLTTRGAHPVRLDVLTDVEARALVAKAAGDAHDSVDADRAITELIGLCTGFPLALGLIAARIRHDPDLLHDFVADLRDLGLDALDSDDPAASLPEPGWPERRCSGLTRSRDESSMSNATVEDAAILFVIDRERAVGRAARDVRHIGAAGDVQSAGRMIEVKAYGKSARGTFLWLEARQYEEAKVNPDFWVYVVDEVGQSDPSKFGLIMLGGAQLAALVAKAKEQRTYVLPFPVAVYDQTQPHG